MKQENRNSSIESLKLLAIVFIIMSHVMPRSFANSMDEVVPYTVPLNFATKSFSEFLVILLRYGGQFGNAIFIICSSWFLLEKSDVNKKKVLYMLADNFTISVLCLGCFVLAGYQLPIKEIIKQFMPITAEAKWFVGCYLLLYMIHPALNQVIDSMKQRQLLMADIIMFCLYSVFNTLGRGSRYFYSNLIGFVCIYFFTAYVKKYLVLFSGKIKMQVIIAVLSMLGLIAMIGITNYLGLHISFFQNKMQYWKGFMNPFILLCAMALFCIFQTQKFVCRSINYISSMSLLIYMIHNNRLIQDHVYLDIYRVIYDRFSYDHLIFWIVVCSAAVFMISFVLSVLYTKTLQKIVRLFCDKLYVIIVRIGNICMNRIMRI